MTKLRGLALVFLLLAITSNPAVPAGLTGTAGEGVAVLGTSGLATDNGADAAGEQAAVAVADPIEPVNRAVFAFNDRTYRWLLRPLGKGYDAVVPEVARTGIRNVFANLGMPVRAASNLLSGRLGDSGTELLRFSINTVFGAGGLFDTAAYAYHIAPRDRDLGLTLGGYGVGHGAYLVLPILGASSLRDTVGLAGGILLDPVTYVKGPDARLALNGLRTVNGITPRLKPYESLTEEAIDPYAAVRDAYVQRRARDAAGGVRRGGGAGPVPGS